MLVTLERNGFEATVNLDDLERKLDAGTRAVSRRILDDFRQRATSILDDAKEAWPVGDRSRPRSRTGPHSRDLLRMDVRINVATGEVRAVVISPAPYTRYIGAGTTKSGKPIVSEQARYNAYWVRPKGYQPEKDAAQRGMVRWTLLGWPERWHAQELVKEIGPQLIEAMQGEVGR